MSLLTDVYCPKSNSVKLPVSSLSLAILKRPISRNAGAVTAAESKHPANQSSHQIFLNVACGGTDGPAH